MFRVISMSLVGALAAALSSVAQSAIVPWPTHCNWQSDRLSCFGVFHEGLARAPLLGDLDARRPTIGYVDKSGAVVIEPRFDDAMDFANGLAAVSLDGKWGYIDARGEWVIAPQFEEANPFGTGGAAMVKQAGRYTLIDRNGATLRRLPYGTFYRSTFHQPEIALFPVRVPTPPKVWRVEDGEGVTLPENTAFLSVSAEASDVFAVRVRQSPERARWGILDANGEWRLSPAVLDATDEPVTDGELTAVEDDDTWRLYDNQGRLLGTRDYRSFKPLLTGTWVAEGDDHERWLVDAAGNEIETLERRASPYVERDEFVLYELEDAVVIARRNGETLRMAAPGLETLYYRDGVLWLYDEARNVMDIRDLAGDSLIDDATRQRLKEYQVDLFTLPADLKAGDAERSLPLAALKPRKAGRPLAVLTADGEIVSNEDWDAFPDTDDVLAPALVKTLEGRIGAIDANGDWVIPADYDDMVAFSGDYTLAQPNFGGRVVIVDRDGERYPLRPQIFEHQRGFNAGLLEFSERSSQGDSRWGLWSVAEGAVVVEPRFTSISEFVDGYAPAAVRTDAGDERWGIIDRQGEWVVEPLHEDRSSPERIAPGIYEIKRRAGEGEHRSDWRYQLVSTETGGPITDLLYESAEVAGPERLLVQPVDGGVRLIDRTGNTLASGEGLVDRFETNGTLALTLFEDLDGALDSHGEWQVEPAYTQSLDFVPPLMQVRVHDGHETVVVDDAGNVQPVDNLTPIPGMMRYSLNLEDDDATALVNTDGEELTRIPGQRAIDQASGANGLVAWRDEDARLYGVMNAQGEKVTGAHFSNLGPMREDRAAFERRKVSGDLVGFIDRAGEIVIPAAYARVSTFSESRALVFGNGQGMFFIDPQGRKTFGFGVLCNRFVVTNPQDEVTWPAELDETTFSCLGEDSGEENGAQDKEGAQ
ncbi:WG repeat-containing protein [Halomonas coralii]|nr:WG repeat-containing protein [Modicisalibacter sp. R2A 31.J]MBZ9559505.1 WG repeat-containing protein [Modicisalibacter sp. R2A 31.J]